MSERSGSSTAVLLRGKSLPFNYENLIIEGPPSDTKDRLTRLLVGKLCGALGGGFSYVSLMDGMHNMWSLVDHTTVVSKGLSRLREVVGSRWVVSDHLLFFLSRTFSAAHGKVPGLINKALEVGKAQAKNTRWVCISEEGPLPTTDYEPDGALSLTALQRSRLAGEYAHALKTASRAGINIENIIVPRVQTGRIDNLVRTIYTILEAELPEEVPL